MDMPEGFKRNKNRTGSINIEALKTSLRQLQPTRQPSKIDVLRELLEVVDQMHHNGVSYADIAAHLTEKTKVEFKEGALKSMLSKLRKEAKAHAEREAGGVERSVSSDSLAQRLQQR
ncbi:hypothetical protein R69608_06922 [Paraburkholderia nemoris]|nr:hypothetical protein R69608_06922 [Paraburkholderia nemoris]